MQALDQAFTSGRKAAARTAPSNRLVMGTLSGTAVLSVVCYWVFFVQPYGLNDLVGKPLLSLYKLSAEDPGARQRLIVGYLVLGGLYWLGWRAALRSSGLTQRQQRNAWLLVLGGATASAALLLFVYPFGAADVFDNIMHGRILGIYGANPFQDVAAQFRSDPFYYYTAWRQTPSAYGPAWEALAGGVAALLQWAVPPPGATGSRATVAVAANVVAFKAVGGAFLAASTIVVAAILRRRAPERALAGVVLLAWNPVILVETLGHGHNDIAMIFWVLAAAWALVGRRYTLAWLALVVGALIKFLPVLMLPVVATIAVRDLPDHRSRVRWALATGVATIALVGLAYAPFWHGLETLSIERRQELFTSSLPAVVWAALQQGLLTVPWSSEAAADRISLAAAALTGAFAVWQAVLAARAPAGQDRQDGSWLAFTRASFTIIMFYLLATCLWFQSWYAIWPLGLAALLPPGHAARLAVLFGYVALAKPLLLEPLWLWQRPLPPKPWRELRLGLALLALPWLYVLFAAVQQKSGVKVMAAFGDAVAIARRPLRYRLARVASTSSVSTRSRPVHDSGHGEDDG